MGKGNRGDLYKTYTRWNKRRQDVEMRYSGNRKKTVKEENVGTEKKAIAKKRKIEDRIGKMRDGEREKRKQQKVNREKEIRKGVERDKEREKESERLGEGKKKRERQ